QTDVGAHNSQSTIPQRQAVTALARIFCSVSFNIMSTGGRQIVLGVQNQ
ncbi:uncharacterized protein PpBr36_06801, partial [Pyricularia pennisetigena]